MNPVTNLFKELFFYIKSLLQSPAKWIFLMYALWVYRVSCMPAVAGGIAQILQIATLFGMLFYAYKWNNTCISWGLFNGCSCDDDSIVLVIRNDKYNMVL